MEARSIYIIYTYVYENFVIALQFAYHMLSYDVMIPLACTQLIWFI